MSRHCHNPEATRRAILESAAAQIHRLGYQATSLDAILVESGVSKGALYHHFANKHELGLAVVDEVYRQPFLETWNKGLHQSADPLTDLLVMLRQRRSETTACSIQHGCPLNNLAQELGGVDESFRQRIEAVLLAWCDLLRDALTRAAAAGLLKEGVDPGREALFVVAALEGATGLAKSTQDPRVYTQCLEALEEHALGLRLRAQPATQPGGVA